MRFYSIVWGTSIGALMVALAAVPAFGTVVTFSDQAAWSAVTTNTTVADYDSLQYWNLYPTLTSGVSGNQATVTAAGADMRATTQGAVGIFNNPTIFVMNAASNQLNAQSVWIDFESTGVFAARMNVWTAWNTNLAVYANVYLVGNPNPITLTPDPYSVPTTNGWVPSGPYNPPAFFGLTSTTAIDKIQLYTLGNSASQGAIAIDNLAWGDLAGDPPIDTPEGASLLYVGLGLVALYFGRRNRPNTAS
jgi:hypothetical protein